MGEETLGQLLQDPALERDQPAVVDLRLARAAPRPRAGTPAIPGGSCASGQSSSSGSAARVEVELVPEQPARRRVGAGLERLVEERGEQGQGRDHAAAQAGGPLGERLQVGEVAGPPARPGLQGVERQEDAPEGLAVAGVDARRARRSPGPPPSGRRSPPAGGDSRRQVRRAAPAAAWPRREAAGQGREVAVPGRSARRLEVETAGERAAPDPRPARIRSSRRAAPSQATTTGSTTQLGQLLAAGPAAPRRASAEPLERGAQGAQDRRAATRARASTCWPMRVVVGGLDPVEAGQLARQFVDSHRTTSAPPAGSGGCPGAGCAPSRAGCSARRPARRPPSRAGRRRAASRAPRATAAGTSAPAARSR